MADVAKTVKVVSNSNASGVSLCELTSSNIEADSLEIHNSPTSNTDPSDLTLNLPSPDEGTSLQELIESELALRKELIESQFSPQISNYSDPIEEIDGTETVEVIQKNGSLKSSPTILSPQDYVEGDYETLDINTQFILAERNHSFQTFTGNDMFFFNTLVEDTQINGADPYLKDEQGVGDPYLDDLDPEIESPQDQNEIEMGSDIHVAVKDVDESSESECITDSSVIKEGIDQITLSTFDPFTTIVDSSKSEPIDNPDIVETPSSECADSDFICMQADNTNGGDILNGSGEKFDGGVDITHNSDENFGGIDYVQDVHEDEGNVEYHTDKSVPTNEVVSVDVNNSMEEFECGSNDLVQTVGHVVVTSVFDTVEIDDDELPLSSPEETGPKEVQVISQVVIPEIDIIPPDDNEISESELVSNEELSLASNGPGPDSDPVNAVADNGFDTWTTVEEAVEESQKVDTSEVRDGAKEEVDYDVAAADSPVHDNDAPEILEVASANSTDTSFSESEKNEMVTTIKTEKKTKKKKSEGGDSTKTKKTKKTKKSDEKENISVNGENSALTRHENSSTDDDKPSPADVQVVDDDLSSVSVKELKSTYANQIQTQSPKEVVKEIDEDILHCGSVQSLRRSFGDLSTLCDKEEGETGEQEAAPISLDSKSSFSKFDQLSKKTVLHVRSVDAAKVQKQFNESAELAPEQTSNCKSCGKQVFQMEQVKAERAVWHKNCFRCKECNKQLTVDIYSSHEGQLYCKPHFRELFKPKAVVEEDNEPPSDKPDLGLEELTSLNVKSRYQVFEKPETPTNEVERSPSSVSVKRSPSILSKLARFQAKGMDIGVTDDSLNGIPYEESSSSSEEEEEVDGEGEEADRDLIRSNRKQRERPVSFSKMEDIKCRWEQGQQAWREEQRQERKQEIQNIRSRLFLGKQGKMKEMYEQAVKDSENATQKKDIGIRSEKAKSIKERFERGEILPDEEEEERLKDEHTKKGMDEDMSVFEAGISKKSRSLFLELDATAAKTQQHQQPMSPIKSPQIKDDAKRKSREVNSPEREIYRDPDVVRSEDKLEDEEVMKTNTAKKMLSIFRQLEENATKEDLPDGPKPLKRFTPPPDYTRDSETSEEETESEEEEEEEEEDEPDPNIVRASDKIEDEFLKQAQNAARAKALRAKFERWEEKENKANANAATNASHAVGNLNGGLELDQSSEHTSIDTTKSLRARFESLKNETQQPKERTPRPKVNRFVEIQTSCAEFCSVCEKKVYPLEKVETGGKLFHKQCFRCLQCNCILRMETYTLNSGKLYCIPHFKQLFIAKGNYEEGFGLDQHKRKWNNRTNNEDDLLNSINNGTDH